MNSTKIPFPKLQSWMHSRITISPELKSDREDKYRRQSLIFRVIDTTISRMFKFLGFKNPVRRWTGFRIFMKISNWWLKFANGLEVHGRQNIPKSGGIFYMNHLGSMDPIILEGIVSEPFGFFTAIGDSWIADAMESLFGFVTRQGTKDQMIEKMIRAIITKNRFFAIWPEGILGRDKLVVQGFSSIIPVYATINAQKDLIPFIPVLVQGSDCYKFTEFRFRMKKVRVDIFPPLFIPREWLEPLEKGGKTPRELIDFVMLHLARKAGQKELGINYHLQRRKTGRGKKKQNAI